MRNTHYLEYGEKEIAHLKAKDPALARVIDEVGQLRRKVIPDMFMALVNAIIGQQISTKAHITMWARAQEMFAPFTPEHLASFPAETLQSCGISMRKGAYIKEIATSILNGSLDLAQLPSMDDDTMCKRLSEIKGIGVWTAEMLMTFSMQRMNILSWGDLAIQRGLRMLYRHRRITPALFAKYKKRYSPYSTVASLYLWEIAGGTRAGYVDPAPKTEAQKKIAAGKHKKMPSRQKQNKNGATKE